MNSLYPNLHERFKSEGVCPICLMEMELAPRYTCTNEHTICYRCKPYYYDCPTCHSPLDMDVSAAQTSVSYTPPPPTHFVPHPLPRKFHENHPRAQVMQDFLAHERGIFPTAPPEDQALRSCAYANLGCWVKVPIYLVDLHESRCQFRPHLEEEHLPTDVAHKHDDLVQCKYRVVGCKVKTSPWRISIHEIHCNYKNRYDEMSIGENFEEEAIVCEELSNPDELVECRYRKYGCMVNMTKSRKPLHQEKCNYRKYHQDGDDDSDGESSAESEYNPDEQVTCRWAEEGCRVRPKRERLSMHEEKCNYRLEECAYKENGCEAMFQPPRKFAHERSCEFAN